MADPKISWFPSVEVLIGQNIVHVSEILNIVIISHETLRNKSLVNSNSRLNFVFYFYFV